MGNKICPKCGRELQLIKLGVGSFSTFKWVCWNDLYMVDYCSFEASQLEETANKS